MEANSVVDERARLSRIRAIVGLRQKLAERQLAAVAQGIQQGTALREKLQRLDPGMGMEAELSLRYLARTLNIIERGLGVLNSQLGAATRNVVQEQVRGHVVEEALRSAISKWQRSEDDKEVAAAVDERLNRALKFDVS